MRVQGKVTALALDYSSTVSFDMHETAVKCTLYQEKNALSVSHTSAFYSLAEPPLSHALLKPCDL